MKMKKKGVGSLMSSYIEPMFPIINLSIHPYLIFYLIERDIFQDIGSDYYIISGSTQSNDPHLSTHIEVFSAEGEPMVSLKIDSIPKTKVSTIHIHINIIRLGRVFFSQ